VFYRKERVMPPAKGLRKGERIATAVLLAVLVASAGSWAGCGRSPAYDGPVEKVSLGLMSGENATLIYVAEREGFFSRYGLEVEIHPYTFGLDALKALERQEVDLAVSSEFAFVSTSFTLTDLEILASIAELQNLTLVARRDAGINSVAGLKGKRIGMKFGIQSHFMLGRLLVANGLSLNDVTIFEGAPGKPVTPEQALKDLLDGTVDAQILPEPYTSEALQQLGDNAFTANAQLGQPWYLVLSAGREYIDGHGEIVNRVLEALVASEEFAAEHPESARRDLAEGAGLSTPIVQRIWPTCVLRVELPQTLIVAMEDEARWAMQNGFFGATSLPNYLDRVYEEGLREVRPESVTIY
jgi:NitT/TauT family transport system substrate-binding protein